MVEQNDSSTINLSFPASPLSMEAREGDSVMETGRRAQRLSVLQDRIVEYTFEGVKYEMTPEIARKLFTAEDIERKIENLEKDMEIVSTITDRYICRLQETLSEEQAVARKLFQDQET